MSAYENKNYVWSMLCFVVVLLSVNYAWAGQVYVRPKEVKTQIIIGSHLPLTGAMTSIGQEQKWAYEKAIKDLNEKHGGIYIAEYDRILPVCLIVLDDKSTPAGAVSCTYDLITKYNADVILGGHAAAFGVIPGSIAAEKYQKYYHATGSFTTPWLEHNFKWSTLMFVSLELQSEVPFVILKKFMDNGNPITNLAIFLENTYDGKAIAQSIRAQAEKNGYKINMEEYCLATESRASDYRTQITKAKTLDIDGIIMFANTTACRDFIKQMHELDFNPKMVFSFKGTWPAEFLKSMGSEADYIISDAHWHQNMPFEGNQQLGQAFYDEFNNYSLSAGLFYATVQTLYAAMTEVASLDSAKIRRALLSKKFETVMGPVNYDHRGLALIRPLAVQFIDRQPVLIYPEEFTNGQPLRVNPAALEK